MKFLKIIAIVVVLVGALVGISFLSTNSTPKVIGHTVVDSPYAKELLDSINKIEEKNKWNKPGVDKLREEINSYKRADAIKENEAEELLYNLDLVYVKQLNLATDAFFKNACNTSNLSELESEIKQFSQKKEYAEKLRNSQNRLGEFRGLQRFVANTQNYINKKSFNLSTTKRILKEIPRYKNSSVTSTCNKMLQEVNRFPNQLKSKHISYLENKVRHLENSYSTTLDEVKSLVSELDEFPNLQIYNRTSSQLNSEVSPLINRVVKLYKKIKSDEETNKD